jgi:hypothetical protein
MRQEQRPGTFETPLYIRQNTFTTKIAKATKGAYILDYKLRALRIAILENFRGLRKCSAELKYSNRGIDSRQDAKYAKFGAER